ncbi:MAG: hypothetical protein HN742_14340 [Lentisphaerae bacterium]|nr:hypothetical protein [Lentisphaerota bacterium]MBT4814458.1 hypothetical protein [Lentisphaerota bacterium]MBT5608722.1 hypothetical protein [Lentisphaerota bacterium]MBT7062166.1 hypothetical protein [Lentisphaerota bacterium]MBT7843054.1 hypothetical protein [Lentisphaerota bacterium]
MRLSGIVIAAVLIGAGYLTGAVCERFGRHPEAIWGRAQELASTLKKTGGDRAQVAGNREDPLLREKDARLPLEEDAVEAPPDHEGWQKDDIAQDEDEFVDASQPEDGKDVAPPRKGRKPATDVEALIARQLAIANELMGE